MSPEAPLVILEKWFREFTLLGRLDEPTQFFVRVMGSAHTHKCPHTGRNPVFCGKTNIPAKLECFFGEAFEISGASLGVGRAANYLILLRI